MKRKLKEEKIIMKNEIEIIIEILVMINMKKEKKKEM